MYHAALHGMPRAAARARLAEERWESQLDAAALSASVARPRYHNSGTLKSSIEYRKRNQLDAGEFEAFYWRRWFYPLNVLALVLAVCVITLGSGVTTFLLGAVHLVLFAAFLLFAFDQ